MIMVAGRGGRPTQTPAECSGGFGGPPEALLTVARCRGRGAADYRSGSVGASHLQMNYLIRVRGDSSSEDFP